MKSLLIATALLAALPGLALAQTAAAPEVQSTAPAVVEATGPTPTLGLTPAQIATWLNTQGVQAGEVQNSADSPYLRVTDGAYSWIILFQSCENGLCADLQFSIGAQTPAVTLDAVNGWNRDRRFLKAFFDAPTTAGDAPTAMVQYDVLLRPGAGPDQLTDYVAIWRAGVPEFLRLFAHRPATATPAPAQ